MSYSLLLIFFTFILPLFFKRRKNYLIYDLIFQSLFLGALIVIAMQHFASVLVSGRSFITIGFLMFPAAFMFVNITYSQLMHYFRYSKEVYSNLSLKKIRLFSLNISAVLIIVSIIPTILPLTPVLNLLFFSILPIFSVYYLGLTIYDLILVNSQSSNASVKDKVSTVL